MFDTKAKAKRLGEIVAEVETLQDLMDSDAANVTPENEVKFKSLLAEGEKIQTQQKNQETILGMKSFLTEPINPQGGDGEFSAKFTGAKSLGEQFVESLNYKEAFVSAAENGAAGRLSQGTRVSVNAKGFLRNPQGAKAVFNTVGTGLNPATDYAGNGGVPILVEQMPLTIADLFSSGETTLNSIPYIQETSYTNAAGAVAEGALKPEATFLTNQVIAPVKKIAVTAKVTDEMFADFPLMRDYVNSRLVFMLAQREEQFLLSGTGVGAQITGVLATVGIQTQAKATDTAPDAIHKAITKIRSIGFFEPDALVINPNDWQNLRLLKDANAQYYGGGPFTGAYGVGGLATGEIFWGLRVVITTAIAAGTCLVGAFKLGGQIFYRQGVTVESTNTNVDDFEKNLQSIRVEERLALCIYRPLAFATVTGI